MSAMRRNKSGTGTSRYKFEIHYRAKQVNGIWNDWTSWMPCKGWHDFHVLMAQYHKLTPRVEYRVEQP